MADVLDLVKHKCDLGPIPDRPKSVEKNLRCVAVRWFMPARHFINNH